MPGARDSPEAIVRISMSGEASPPVTRRGRDRRPGAPCRGRARCSAAARGRRPAPPGPASSAARTGSSCWRPERPAARRVFHHRLGRGGCRGSRATGEMSATARTDGEVGRGQRREVRAKRRADQADRATDGSVRASSAIQRPIARRRPSAQTRWHCRTSRRGRAGRRSAPWRRSPEGARRANPHSSFDRASMWTSTTAGADRFEDSWSCRRASCRPAPKRSPPGLPRRPRSPRATAPQTRRRTARSAPCTGERWVNSTPVRGPRDSPGPTAGDRRTSRG